jgi:hypothetical protein
MQRVDVESCVRGHYLRGHYYRVLGRLDGSRPQEGTVTVARDSGLIAVHPLHRRREYVLPLAAVAEMIVARVVRAEV